MLVKHP